MTERNPNVFYETGYAHALGKTVILLTQKSDDIPFDMKHYPHIIYEGKISYLKNEIKKRVEWYLQNPEKKMESAENPLELYYMGTKFHAGTVIYYEKVIFESDNSEEAVNLVFALDVYNPRNRTYNANNVEVGLVTPRVFWTSQAIVRPSVRTTPEEVMFFLPRIGQLLPNCWQTINIEMNIQPVLFTKDKNYDCIIRVFDEIGPKDIPFKIRFS